MRIHAQVVEGTSALPPKRLRSLRSPSLPPNTSNESSPPVDRLHLQLAPLLRRQHGVFTRADAESVGMTRRQIDRRHHDGLIVRCSPGVFRVVSVAASPLARLWAVHLAVPGSVISHRSATWILSYRDRPPRPEVSGPVGCGSVVPGAIIHRRRPDMLARSVVVDGMRVTRPEVTVLEMAGVMGDAAFRALVDRYAGGHRAPIERLADWFSVVCGRGTAGSARARRELERRVTGDVAESVLERAFIDLVEGSPLPMPTLQFVPPWDRDVRIDAAYVDMKVLIELDSHRFHANPDAFEVDRRRDQIAAAHGWRTCRFTWAQIRHEPDHVVRVLMSVLAPTGYHSESGDPSPPAMGT